MMPNARAYNPDPMPFEKNEMKSKKVEIYSPSKIEENR
jgi:hypothetical protein